MIANDTSYVPTSFGNSWLQDEIPHLISCPFNLQQTEADQRDDSSFEWKTNQRSRFYTTLGLRRAGMLHPYHYYQIYN